MNELVMNEMRLLESHTINPFRDQETRTLILPGSAILFHIDAVLRQSTVTYDRHITIHLTPIHSLFYP